MLGRLGGPTLTCEAASVLLPVGPAITLGLITEEFVNNALVHGFPGGRGGRIAVGFVAGAQAWRLTVEDSGIVGQPGPGRRGNGLMIARLLLLQLDGTLETESGVIGGTRRVVSIPRPQHRGVTMPACAAGTVTASPSTMSVGGCRRWHRRRG